MHSGRKTRKQGGIAPKLSLAKVGSPPISPKERKLTATLFVGAHFEAAKRDKSEDSTHGAPHLGTKLALLGGWMARD